MNEFMGELLQAKVTIKPYDLSLNLDANITPELATSVQATLMQARRQRLSVDFYINCRGGDVCSALSIHDMIARYPFKVRTIAAGACMSAAVLVYLAAEDRLVTPNAVFYLHNVCGETAQPEVPAIVEMNRYRATQVERTFTAVDALKEGFATGFMLRLSEPSGIESSEPPKGLVN